MAPAIVILFFPLSVISADTQTEISKIDNRQPQNMGSWREHPARYQNIVTRETREPNQMTQSDNFQFKANNFGMEVTGVGGFRPQVSTDEWNKLNRSAALRGNYQFGHSHPRDTGTLKQNLPGLRNLHYKEIKNGQRFRKSSQNLINQEFDHPSQPTKKENMTNISESDSYSVFLIVLSRVFNTGHIKYNYFQVLND